MRWLFLFLLGLAMLLAGLWLPFYIGGVLLPEGWASTGPDAPDYWWFIPASGSLVMLLVGLVFAGAGVLAKAVAGYQSAKEGKR